MTATQPQSLKQNVASAKKPFLISIPHSGEQLPPEALWLHRLPQELLTRDIDRFVDVLYAPVIADLGVPSVFTQWHRYAIDLNRWKDDVDVDSVEGHANPSGKFSRGLHWVKSTLNEKIMTEPMSAELHAELVEKYFEPFHGELRGVIASLRERGSARVYHIDAHSMPSMGTKEHRDPGEKRKDIVVSDCLGKSCSTWYRDLVLQAYQNAGFSVGYNWPYMGGRVTETYGQPDQGVETIQVELNRGVYMDETTKELVKPRLSQVQKALGQAIREIYAALPELPVQA